MLTLEMAIQKIQQFPPEQRNKVIEFVELLEFQSNQRQEESSAPTDRSNHDLCKLAGIWKGRNITIDDIRSQAWGDKQ